MVPTFANCDGVVMEAMTTYWSSRGGDMHFFRKSVIEKLKKFQGDSEVMDRILKSKNNLPFMD